MAGSRTPGGPGRDPFGLPPLTPGPLGCNDAADPLAPGGLLADTPGALGCNDHAAPDAGLTLGVPGLHLTLSWDRDLLLWDYDPGGLLENPGLCPDFVEAAHNALGAAVRAGLRPKVHEAYRSPQESDRKHKLWKAGKGGRAAAGWHSCHNYGLAMDVWLYDARGRYIDNHVRGWYRLYKQLAKVSGEFVWGEGFGDGDADHFEYHPNWPAGASGAFLLKVKVWAEKAALSAPGAGAPPGGRVGPPPEPDPADWLPYFWWAAGAGGQVPPGGYAATNQPPKQK
jgi:hypothetical protein